MSIVKKIKPLKGDDNPIKTDEIEYAVAKLYNYRKNLIVPNLSYGLDGMHECDLFIIKPSDYAVEVEIKISIADLKADFKKEHKHIDTYHRIHEFYYALPFDLYEKAKDLIPETAGIIVCKRYGKKVTARLVRNAKRIKGARKLTLEEKYKVARLGTMRIWGIKNKIINKCNKIEKQSYNK